MQPRFSMNHIPAKKFNQQLSRRVLSDSWNHYGTLARFKLRQNQCYMSIAECQRCIFEGVNQFSSTLADPVGHKVNFLTYEYTRLSETHCLINTSILTGSLESMVAIKTDVIVNLNLINVFKIKDKVYRYVAHIDMAQRLAIAQISSDESQVIDESINLSYSDTIPTDGRVEYRTYQSSFYGSIIFYRKVNAYSYIQNAGMLLPFWRARVYDALFHFYPRCITLVEWLDEGKTLKYSDFLDLYVRLGGLIHGDIQLHNLVIRNRNGTRPTLLCIDNHNLDGARYFRTNIRYYLHTRDPQIFKPLSESSSDLHALLRLMCDLNGSFTVEGDDSVVTLFIDEQGALVKDGNIMINLKSTDVVTLNNALIGLRNIDEEDRENAINSIFATTLSSTKTTVTDSYRDNILSCRTLAPALVEQQQQQSLSALVDQYSLCESYASLSPSILSTIF